MKKKMTCMRPVLSLLSLLLSMSASLQAQNIIGGANGDASAILDLQSSSKGLLIPRMSSAERSAVANPAAGLMIYNTTLGCIELNLGSSSSPDWLCMAVAGKVASLDCSGAVQTGSLVVGTAASGVSAALSYTGGNGNNYAGQTVSSTGVTGLTATLNPGTFAASGGTLTYTITGTPAAAGTAGFALVIGGQTCVLGLSVALPVGVITALNCAGATTTGTLTAGLSASGVSVSVPYTGGNGGTQAGQTVTSGGVTGLTATLSAGTFASGSGSLQYTITGTPSAAGTATFALSIGGQSCTLSMNVSLPVGAITALNCAGASLTGTLRAGVAASGTSVSVPYTGGNGGTHSGQTVTSGGVTSLTATLSAGTFASGGGSLQYTITGTPSAAGTATFALSMGGQSCTLSLTVAAAQPVCSAFVASGVSKVFMCHNLGANTDADPFTPSWELIGNYYQWGRNPTCFGRDGVDGSNPCSSPVYGAAAPWGSMADNDNADAITGWSTSAAANSAWVDGSKTANDPCPAGFRVPTAAQWTGVISSNTRTNVGTFSNSATNYSSGVRFGNSLFLPAAGSRVGSDGSLGNRGSNGGYWSSTEGGSDAQALLFFSGGALVTTGNRASGFSLRCVAE